MTQFEFVMAVVAVIGIIALALVLWLDRPKKSKR